MLNFFYFSFLLHFISIIALANDKADLYVFSNNKKKTVKEAIEEPLYSFLEESVDFINFQESAPTLRQSIIYKGLSPRQLDISYNGFKLIDPSSIEGVYDLFGLMQFKGLSLVDNKGTAELSILSTLKEDRKELSLSLSSLEQSNLSGSISTCKESVCYSLDAVFDRQGGVSQLDDSENDPLFNSVKDYERDFLNSYGLSFSRLSTGKKRLATHFFIIHSEADNDDLNNPVSPFDDQDAESRNLTYFLGQELTLGSSIFRASYFNNSREQTNEIDIENPNFLDTSQDGRSLNLGFVYKYLSFNFDYENFKIQSLKKEDFLISADVHKKIMGVMSDLKLGYSKERDLFANMSFSYKDFSLSFKKTRPSLFQIFDNFSGNRDLKAETLVGLSYLKDLIIFNKENKAFIDVSYFRIWDLIDFFDPDGFGSGVPGSFQNVKTGENLFVTLNTSHKVSSHDFGFFIRYLRAKDLSSGLDLSRRPRWTSGFNAKSFFKGGFESNLKLKLVGERRDSDSTELESVFFSDLILSKSIPFGKVKLSLLNLSNETRQVFSKIGRRGFEIKLGVDLIF